ncbi:MAG: polymerase, sigma-24 subunit, subfamily [Jatrophihabitantaceae bacterium]|nr:polymerase, sigma-24 subunit, subfamily [Jatrophihabitantaceae bacterium]
MRDTRVLADQFEAHRGRLRAVGYRMLGSLSEADDAVQEAWLRLQRSDDAAIDNLGGWLTTVVGRVCLDLLRSRAARREEPLEVYVPDPVIAAPGAHDPEREALLADSVGLALLVVLDALPPAERLAFVLHDTFAVPFEEIAPVVGRTVEATRQLASRGRRRVRGASVQRVVDPVRQRAVVEAFLAASREGSFDALVAVLDPDVLVRADYGGVLQHPVATSARPLLRGAANVASQALMFRSAAREARIVLINGALGLVTMQDGVAYSVMSFTEQEGRIAQLDILADPVRLARLDLSALV